MAFMNIGIVKPQHFSIPRNLINYIMSIASAESYKKIASTCKELALVAQIVLDVYLDKADGIFKCLWISSNGRRTIVNLDDVQRKVVIINHIYNIYERNDLVRRDFPNSVLNKIRSTNGIRLYNQVIPIKSFRRLGQYVTYCSLKNVLIEDEDGRFLPFEEIVKLLPKLKKLYYWCNTQIPVINLASFTHLSKFCKNVEFMGFLECHKGFNVASLLEMMKDSTAKICIEFGEAIDEAEKQSMIKLAREACKNSRIESIGLGFLNSEKFFFN